MTPVSSPWPFAQWGIDIMGSFSLGKKQLRFLIVVIDYFTKWVEAKPVTTIGEAKVTSFVWKNITCRFGVPHVIKSDNGKQFDNQVSKILPRPRSQEPLIFSKTPLGQWSDRSDEQMFAQNYQNSA